MPVNAGAAVGSTCSARSVREVSKTDVGKYLAALRRAQVEIDLHPELYRHHHLRAVPEKYREQLDVRTFGTGERIVFLPYTRESSRRPGTARPAAPGATATAWPPSAAPATHAAAPSLPDRPPSRYGPRTQAASPRNRPHAADAPPHNRRHKNRCSCKPAPRSFSPGKAHAPAPTRPQ